MIDESYLSKAVKVITTPKWCDVAFPMGGVGQPNFGDISAVVGAFQGQATGLVKARAKVQPRVPNPSAAVDFSDISATVAAFQTGGVYPYAGPDMCP